MIDGAGLDRLDVGAGIGLASPTVKRRDLAEAVQELVDGTTISVPSTEIKGCLINLSDNEFTISREMRIAQMIISKYESVEWVKSESLSGSNRGSGGFGHSGE